MGKAASGHNSSLETSGPSRPLPFAGITRIRFIGLDLILSAFTAPLAIVTFLFDSAVFVNGCY